MPATILPPALSPPAPEPSLDLLDLQERQAAGKTHLIRRAQTLLNETDHIEFRTPTPERTPSSDWIAWREQLREVVRSNATEIPPEPSRYV